MGALGSIIGWEQVSQSCVSVSFVVDISPICDCDFGFDQVVELADVQAFVAASVAERFDVAAAPILAWWDKRDLDSVET